MPDFLKGPAYRTPFGEHNWLRSTRGVRFEHYTLFAPSVPYETIDGGLQRLLFKGEAIAKITSGPGNGKVGVFQAAGSAAQEVQTVTKGTGTYTGGTYVLTVLGNTTAPIAYNATATAVQTAVDAAVGQQGAITVTGGPLSTTPLVFTFAAPTGNVSPVLIDVTGVTGQTGAAAVVETTPGVAGAADGRQTLANIVGINNTFLPWQLLDRDVEIAVAYVATGVQAWCFERDAAGVRIALQDATANAMRSVKGMDILFK